MLYPFIFQPIFKERIWGGRNLAKLFGKILPGEQPIGESWEISDRPGDASVISNGPFAGKDLHWLMENYPKELLCEAHAPNGRFPLLIKLLDAQEKLSLQVHPPAAKALELGGEPKTEMWYIADAAPGAELYVGLRRGVTPVDFESKVRDGSVADCFHRIRVKTGDAMFLPSGRVHAIGAGLVIFEIQQNSDTTYRVFDWNRVGLDGKSRELHIEQSLASIDFTDFEPGIVAPKISENPNLIVRRLVRDPLFIVELWKTRNADTVLWRKSEMQIIGVVTGTAVISSTTSDSALKLAAGEFCLIPAGLPAVELATAPGSEFLRVTAGKS